jgi:hypothetical protein
MTSPNESHLQRLPAQASAWQLLDSAADGQLELRAVLDNEAKAITDIGNGFHIGQSEVGKAPIVRDEDRAAAGHQGHCQSDDEKGRCQPAPGRGSFLPVLPMLAHADLPFGSSICPWRHPWIRSCQAIDKKTMRNQVGRGRAGLSESWSGSVFQGPLLDLRNDGLAGHGLHADVGRLSQRALL